MVNLLARTRSHFRTSAKSYRNQRSLNVGERIISRRGGVGFDGRGNSVTFGVVQRRPFFGSRYGDMKSAGPIGH